MPHIYSIYCRTTNAYYVGSTHMNLGKRIRLHINSYNVGKNKTTCSKVLENINFVIRILNSPEIMAKEDLRALEAEAIRNLRAEGLTCVNKNIPGRSAEQWQRDRHAHRMAVNARYRAAHPNYQKEYYRLRQYRAQCAEFRNIDF
jgi:hypothetical protein